MKQKIDKAKLKELILAGISSEELNSKYDYSNVTDMTCMFCECSSLRNLEPMNFHLYDFSELDNKHLKKKYPEIYI